MNGTILMEELAERATTMSRFNAHVIPEEIRVRHRGAGQTGYENIAKHRFLFRNSSRADKVLAKWSRKQSALIAQHRLERGA